MWPALVLGFVLTGGASAQQEACPSATSDQLDQHLDSAEVALSKADLNEARYNLGEARRLVGCGEFRLRPEQVARFGRSMGLVSFYRQEEVSALNWLVMSTDADPDLAWPQDVGPGHPYRSLLEDLETPAMGGPEGVVLVPPKKGAVFVDGHLLLEPTVRAEVPHIVQLFDKKGAWVATWWQDGSVFEPTLVSAEAQAPTAPKWADEAPAVVDAPKDPKTPKEPKTPRQGGDGPSWAVVGSGAGVVLVSGALFALAAGTAAKLDKGEYESGEEITQLRSRANLITLSSGVAAVAGVGLVGVGFVVSGQGPGLRVGFQF